MSYGQRRNGPALALALFALTAPAATGQDRAPSKPDFSGDWVLQSPASPSATMARRMSIQQDGRRLTITRIIGERTEKEQHRISGGSAGSARGRKRNFAGVWWSGDMLRFDQGEYSGRDGAELFSERSETWSLDEVGLLTIDITLQRSGAPSSRTTLVYRKDQASKR
jgi:hypothetical protein